MRARPGRPTSLEVHQRLAELLRDTEEAPSDPICGSLRAIELLEMVGTGSAQGVGSLASGTEEAEFTRRA